MGPATGIGLTGGMSVGVDRVTLRQKSNRWTIAAAVSGIVLSLVFGFQNCADPMDMTSENSSQDIDLPFAFDTRVDTISYMSCAPVGAGVPERAYYSFRVGAYRAGSGLSLNPDFLAATVNMTNTQRAEALGRSPLNRGATLQLSIREYGRYDNVLTSAGGSNSEGRDYDNLLAPLDSNVIAEQLAGLSPNQRVNYFSGIPGVEARSVQGSIKFMDSESLAKSVRDNLEGSFMLALLYGDADAQSDLIPKGPNPARNVYGSGFRVNFRFSHALQTEPANGNPPGYTTGTIRRALASVSEVEPLTGRTSLSSWACPNQMSFLVVRPADLGTNYGLGQAFCDTSPENPNAIPVAYRDAYNAIRSVLRVEDWHVDVIRRCVVPKQTGGVCYGRDQAKVNYYGNLGNTANCGADAQGNFTRVNLGGTQFDVMCPHYVSVCVRQ